MYSFFCVREFFLFTGFRSFSNDIEWYMLSLLSNYWWVFFSVMIYMTYIGFNLFIWFIFKNGFMVLFGPLIFGFEILNEWMKHGYVSSGDILMDNIIFIYFFDTNIKINNIAWSFVIWKMFSWMKYNLIAKINIIAFAKQKMSIENKNW